jgi:two-component system cell cycle sensor histidine kinase/response regulator CckA
VNVKIREKRRHELRQQAEMLLAEKIKNARQVKVEDVKEIVYELQVHQIELEIQNEELRRIQAELQESQNKYLGLYNSAPTGYFTLDRNGVILELNIAGAELFGIEKSKLLKTNFTHLISPDSQDTFYFHCKKLFKTAARQNCEIKFLKTDGSLLYAHIESIVVPDASGNLNHRIILIDISERKRAEEALQQSQAQYQDLYDSAPIAYYSVGIDGGIKKANKAGMKLLGYSLEELQRMKFLALYADESKAKAEQLYRKFRQGIGWENEEMVYLRKDGQKVHGLLSVSPILDENGCIIESRSVVVDITEHWQAEADRQRAQKLESIGLLAGGIAHDFNNVLTGILGNIELAIAHLKQNEEDAAKEILAEAEKASLRAKDLTQQLLTFSKGGAPIKTVTQINTLLEEATTFALRGSKTKPEFAIPENLWAVEIDKGQLNQAISNIIINANQAMPKGGIININASNVILEEQHDLSLPDGNYIVIAIKDHGIGIPEETKDRMFEPYFSTKKSGTGLGLATSYSIIKYHGGIITFESELGAGATFYIYLPAFGGKTPKEKNAVVETAVRGEGRILVMDDDEIIREMLGKMLTLAGYEIELTRDGAEAIERYTEAKVAKKTFDAVIMDLTIPGGMGGKEAITKLLEIDPHAKVIVSSGYATDPIMSNFKKYGYSAVVTKPYNAAQIEKTLQSLLKKK